MAHSPFVTKKDERKERVRERKKEKKTEKKKDLLRPRKLENDTEESFQERFFLMEEPEARLHPSLVVPLFSLLRGLCEENDVKFVVISNPSDVC